VPIREELEAVMAGVATARLETFKTHSLAARIKHEWRDAVAAVVDDDSYKIEGSPREGEVGRVGLARRLRPHRDRDRSARVLRRLPGGT